MYEYEEDSDIIGLSCTLLNPYKGYTEGTIVGNYGNTIVVRLESGKEISEYRDEVIILLVIGYLFDKGGGETVAHPHFHL